MLFPILLSAPFHGCASAFIHEYKLLPAAQGDHRAGVHIHRIAAASGGKEPALAVRTHALGGEIGGRSAQVGGQPLLGLLPGEGRGLIDRLLGFFFTSAGGGRLCGRLRFFRFGGLLSLRG